jgi:hypothetical protein
LKESENWMTSMGANSSKADETGNSQVYALQVVKDWLDREGGRQRIPLSLRGLLDATMVAIARGDAPPEKDGLTLTALWALSRGQRQGDQISPLRGSEVTRWWQAREGHMRQACLAGGCGWEPRLVVRTGGGRHLPTNYAFELLPIELAHLDPLHSDDLPEPSALGHLRYRIEPVKPAWWLRMLVGSKPFPVNSWRGYILLGSAALNLMLIGLIWLGIFVAWSKARPLTSADIATCAFALVVSAALWVATRPIRQLPTHRVSLANDAFLSFSATDGQLRTMRDGDSKLASRVFSLVRHWGICPVCAAEVDLASGGTAFPDRLIGRCHDAPLEHVFSFDPVRLVGEPLRAIFVLGSQQK